MAEKKKRRVIKKSDTVRDKIAKADQPQKERRIRASIASGTGKLGKVTELGRREYHPIKLPDNKIGRFLTSRRRLLPKFFVEAWAELRQVTWPNRHETFKLTLAVVIFALLFGGLVAIIDYGLDKLFRNVILN